jgi:hypothetical protein
VQLIDLPTCESAFDAWGDARSLERLLHRYFEIAEWSVAPLVRIRWEHGGPVIRLRWSGLPLIVMGPPTFEMSAGRRAIGVPIVGGLLSRAAPRASLRIILTHRSPEICALVDLEGYCPRGQTNPVIRRLCRQVQARLHVRVGRRFLRELAAGWNLSR